jgi:enoyl-CoA hydratase
MDERRTPPASGSSSLPACYHRRVTFETLSLNDAAPIAELRLGVLDARTPAELARACQAVRDRADVICVLLTADAGALAVRSLDTDLAVQSEDGAYRCLELLPQPVIAAVEDAVTGAGLELLLACDMRVAGERASFAMTHVGDGTVPSHGGTQRLPRLAGRAKAAEMILLGTVLSAAEALGCGLVNAVASQGGAREEAMRIARAIAERGPAAVRFAKEAVLRGLDMPLEQALRYETDLTVILQTTGDRAEGVRAFLEKRPPRFEGR